MQESKVQSVNQKKDKKGIVPLIAIVMILAGICVFFNRGVIFDAFSSMFYKPSDRVMEVINSIGLTKHGKLIFGASTPSLDEKDEFNEHCKSHDQDISVLGCYTKNKIYLYNINSEELNGVVESTAAHELLHAVWNRMDTSERGRIGKLLNDVYNDSRYHELLAEDLETYPELERVEELHSRVGTEIAELPEELEKHYAKYFADQDKVVDYYDSYIEPFRVLSDEIDELSARLENLNTEIEEKTANYYKKAEELSSKIDEFNRCANTAGCFVLDSTFYATRNELLNEQSAMEDTFNEINGLIEEYNNLVAEYNDNVLRGENLERIINSNAEVENTIK